MDGGSNVVHNRSLLISNNREKEKRRRKKRKRIPPSLYWSLFILVLYYWRFGFVVEYIFSSSSDNNQNGSTSIIPQQKLSMQQQQQQQKQQQFPPEKQEDWLDDIDTSRPAPCGWSKCLFESKSNKNDSNNDMMMATTTNRQRQRQRQRQQQQQQKKKYGYLVYQKYKNTKVNREQIDKGWILAQKLTAKFGIRHLLLGPPYHIHNVTDQLTTDLNSNTYKPNGSLSTKKAQYHSTTNNNITITTTTDSNSKYHYTPIIIQPVEILSNITSILFGVTDSKMNAFMKQFQDVITNLEEKNHQITTTTTISYDEFKLNLQNDINSTKSIFNKQHHQHIHHGSKNGNNDDNKYYLLLADFQIMFDLQFGYIYHLDFDRYYEILFNKKKSWIIKNRYNNENLLYDCMEKLNYATQQLLEWKKKEFEKRRKGEIMTNNKREK